MRKIFIDCGSHDGCSIRKFRDLYDKKEEYEIYSFEPNPHLQKYYDQLYNKHTHYSKGVWVKDGKIDFYVSGCTGGSTLIETKYKHNEKKRITRKIVCNLILPIEEKINIDCIDLSYWIKNTFSKDDYIILKMDIEGAEYEILYKMIKESTLDYINELLIEFHNHKSGYTQHDDNCIISILKEKNIKVDTTWDAMLDSGKRTKYLIENKCTEYNNEKITQG